MGRSSWEDEYIYLCIDKFKKRDQGSFYKCNERKNTYIERIPETNPFYLL